MDPGPDFKKKKKEKKENKEKEWECKDIYLRYQANITKSYQITENTVHIIIF